MENQCDLPPWDVRLSAEQLVRQGFDCLADFKQPDPDRVEDQTVRQAAAFKMRVDRLDRGLDVSKPLPVPVGHNATRSRSARARMAGLRSSVGTGST